MEIYKNEYWIMLYEKESELLIQFWSSNTENMSAELFKSELINYLEIVKEYQPKRLLSYSPDFFYPISPKEQEWIDKNIIPPTFSLGLRYVAVVIPQEFISNLSVQQTMEEPEASKLVTRYFDNEEDAKKWLLKNA